VKTNFDDLCKESIKNDPNVIIAWYLMASYVYYIQHTQSLLTDDLYDNLAKFIRLDWDKIEHRHKHLITQEDLAAGTLYNLKEAQYPRIVVGAIGHLRGRN